MIVDGACVCARARAQCFLSSYILRTRAESGATGFALAIPRQYRGCRAGRWKATIPLTFKSSTAVTTVMNTVMHNSSIRASRSSRCDSHGAFVRGFGLCSQSSAGDPITATFSRPMQKANTTGRTSSYHRHAFMCFPSSTCDAPGISDYPHPEGEPFLYSRILYRTWVGGPTSKRPAEALKCIDPDAICFTVATCRTNQVVQKG